LPEQIITTGDPGWSTWSGHNPYVFAGEQTDTYAPSRLVDAAL